MRLLHRTSNANPISSYLTRSSGSSFMNSCRRYVCSLDRLDSNDVDLRLIAVDLTGGGDKAHTKERFELHTHLQSGPYDSLYGVSY